MLCGHVVGSELQGFWCTYIVTSVSRVTPLKSGTDDVVRLIIDRCG